MAKNRVRRKKPTTAPDPPVATSQKPVAAPAPLYKHKCKDCVYLGFLEHPSTQICPNEPAPAPCDLYVCLIHWPTPVVVARYSKVPPESFEGMQSALDNSVPELAEALRRAVQLGILTSEGQVPDDKTTPSGIA